MIWYLIAFSISHFIFATQGLGLFDIKSQCSSNRGTRPATQMIMILYSIVFWLFSTDNQTDGVWLGGADLLVENEWEWVKDGRPFTYTRWAPGEPSHYQRVGDDENCLDLLPHKRFMWNDESCAWKMNFLCKTR